jgi:cytochrome c oxidase subunit I
MNPRKLLKVFILLLIVSVLPILIVWLQSKIILRFSPFIGFIFLFVIAVNLIPVFIVYYQWLKKDWFTINDYETSALFGIGALCGLLGWILSNKSTMAFQVRDTVYIIPYSGIFLYTAALFAFYSAMYFLLSFLNKGASNILFYRIHFWATFILINMLLVLSYARWELDKPHRYVEIEKPGLPGTYSGWEGFRTFIYFDRLLLFCLLLLFATQMIFIVNVLYSFHKPRKN